MDKKLLEIVARALCRDNSKACNINNDDNWNMYSEVFMTQAHVVLAELASVKAIDAEGIKADEATVRDPHHFGDCAWKWDGHKLYQRALGQSKWTECKRIHVTKQRIGAIHSIMFTRPPAQAAQVDQVGELLAIIHGDGGHYQAEHGLQKAAKDAQEKVIQMMTKIAAAEPVAQVEGSGNPNNIILDFT